MLKRIISYSALGSYLPYSVARKFDFRNFNCGLTSVVYHESSKTSTEILEQSSEDLFSFSDCCDDNLKKTIARNMTVIDNFISKVDEKSLLDEIEPYMKRLRYEFDHWDNAIHGFRETERVNWNEENSAILNKIREIAFPDAQKTLGHIHILDLSEKGHIKPHVDSVRFCGNTIAGLSLLSDSVMRLVKEKNESICVDILLKRRSLYIMKDSARYDFTHAILPNSESKFKGEIIQRSRRISLMCRNKP